MGIGQCFEVIDIHRREDIVQRRKQILFFSPGYHDLGGAAGRSRNIAVGLADRGWRVRMVVRAGSLRRLRVTRRPNLVVVEVPGFDAPRTGALLFLLVSLPLGVLWARKATAVLALQLMSPSTAGAMSAGLWRRPFIALATTSGQLSELDYILGSGPVKIRRALLRSAAFIVGQTADAAVELGRLADSDHIAVLPNPVQTVSSHPLNGDPVVLFSGRFSSEKDLPRLLDAWEILAQELPSAQLRLVGAGGNYRSIEQLLRNRVANSDTLQRSVAFVGWVTDIGGQLVTADVFAFPSLSEGMSNSLLEACAWKRVIVASDIPANRAVLGDDYPLLFPVGDTLALVTGLRTALTDETIRLAAVACVSRRLPLFSTQTVLTQLEDLIALAQRHRERLRSPRTAGRAANG